MKNTSEKYGKGKIALVTGSTGGVGMAILKKLASCGYDVVMNGLVKSQADVDESIAKITKEHGVKVLFSPADHLHVVQIEAMMEDILQKFGRIDVLVNCAGILPIVTPVEDIPVEMWDKIIAVNLSAIFHTTRLAVPVMKKQGWGRIINIASAHGRVASPYKSAYVASKHGLAGFTKSVALETAQDGITCNAICPGYTLTPNVEFFIDAVVKSKGMSREDQEAFVTDVLLEGHATKKFVRVEEIADFAAFLCMDSSASITGAMLSIDGGWTARGGGTVRSLAKGI